MKKIVSALLICTCLTAHAGYIELRDSSDKNVGGKAAQAEDDASIISMLGWGIGLAVAITIVSIVIHQSLAPATDDTPVTPVDT